MDSMLSWVMARLAEPSTFSAIAAVAGLFHVTVTQDQFTFWASVLSGLLGMVLKEGK